MGSVVRDAAHKKAADKPATEKATAKTQGRSYKEEFPGYVGPDTSSASPSPFTFDDTSDYRDANIPSFLLLLPTNIFSLGHILPRRAG